MAHGALKTHYDRMLETIAERVFKISATKQILQTDISLLARIPKKNLVAF